LQKAAEDHHLDWRLLASVCFQESHFDPNRTSWAGAVGLMQVMPSAHGVAADSLKIPEVNLEIGAEFLRKLYDVYGYLPDKQRMKFTLAAYNAGMGHVDDARILSVMREKNPNQWDGSVEESLLLLRKPEYHREVRYGYVRGTETVAYVRQVLRRYQLFKDLTRREVARRTPTSPQASETVVSSMR
jgi:membrane-bound lytic murein transglycosylase F